MEVKAQGAAANSLVKFSMSGEVRLFSTYQNKIDREYLPGQSTVLPESQSTQVEAEVRSCN